MTIADILKLASTDTVDDSEVENRLVEAHALFGQLGDELAALEASDHVLPADVRAEQMLVAIEGDIKVIKLLPPLKLKPTAQRREVDRAIRMELLKQLYNSLYYGTKGVREEDNLKLFIKTFMEAFTFGQEIDATDE